MDAVRGDTFTDIKVHGGRVYAACTDDPGTVLCVKLSDGAEVWRQRHGETLDKLAVLAARVAGDGDGAGRDGNGRRPPSCLISAGDDAVLRMWDLATGEPRGFAKMTKASAADVIDDVYITHSGDVFAFTSDVVGRVQYVDVSGEDGGDTAAIDAANAAAEAKADAAAKKAKAAADDDDGWGDSDSDWGDGAGGSATAKPSAAKPATHSAADESGCGWRLTWSYKHNKGPMGKRVDYIGVMAVDPASGMVVIGSKDSGAHVVLLDPSNGEDAKAEVAMASVDGHTKCAAARPGQFFVASGSSVFVYDSATLGELARVTPNFGGIKTVFIPPVNRVGGRCAPNPHHPALIVGEVGEVLEWWPDSRLGWAKVEVVRDIGAEQVPADAFTSKYGNWIDFAINFGIMVNDTLQMVTFAFTSATPPTLQGTKETLSSIQGFGLPSVDYTGVFVSMVIAVGLAVSAFAVQESVETRAMLRPDSRLWSTLWLVMGLGLKILTLSAMVPLLRVQFEALDCTFHADAPATWDVSFDGGATVVECASARHIPYAIVSVLCIAVYVPLSLRFLRVGGALEAIDARLNPFDWSGDSDPTPPYLHLLSMRTRGYWMASLVAKVMLTLIATFLTTNVVGASLLMILVGIALLLAGARNPYFSAAANRLRTGLDSAALWMWTTSVVAAAWTPTGVAADDESRDSTLSLLPIGVVVCFALGVWAHAGVGAVADAVAARLAACRSQQGGMRRGGAPDGTVPKQSGGEAAAAV